jgi:hypothetical protein
MTRSGRSAKAVLAHLARERVAVNAEEIRGPAQVAIGFEQDLRDELLLELALRFVVADAFGYHFVDKPLELITEWHDTHILSRLSTPGPTGPGEQYWRWP